MNVTLRGVTLADPAFPPGDEAPVDLEMDSDGVIVDVRTPAGRTRRQGDVDAAGLYAFPGLIDSHVHLCFDANKNPEDWLAEATENEVAALAAANAQETIARGVTTVRDLGSAGDTVRQLKVRVRAGHVRGPRILCAGPAVTVRGGHCYFVGEELRDGDESAAVGRHAAAGDEWVKVVVTGGMLTRGSNPLSLQFEAEIVERILSYARHLGLRSAAHVLCSDGMDIAVAAGVNTIEHGVGLNGEHAARMVASGQALVPTLATAHLAIVNEPDPATEDVRQALELRDAHLDSVRTAYATGVAILAGSDAGCPHVRHGDLVEELLQLTATGLDALAACRSATVEPARVLGLGHLGRLARGMAADILLLQGDPRADVSFLRDITTVYLRGQVVAALG